MTEPWVVCSARPDRREIALTFDDGPSGSTEEVLEILGTHGARATFFVLGEWVDRLPQVVQGVAEQGHELGNHTWDHVDGRIETNPEVWRGQIERTSAAIATISGQTPRLFRPPFGAVPGRFARVAAACGLYATVMWTVQTQDYEGNDEHERIQKEVVAEAFPGAIVLHHDGWAHPSDKKNHGSPQAGTIRALPRILGRLADEGYRFVTVSELLAA